MHTGQESSEAASALGARAFTVDNDVHFNAGEYAPGSKEGDKLLAHELTHVVQGQRSGIQRKADEHGGEHEAEPEHVSQPGDPAEQEADAVAETVAAGLHGAKAGKPQSNNPEPGARAAGQEHGHGGPADGGGPHASDANSGEVGAPRGASMPQPAPISAKRISRKIFRQPMTDVPVTNKYHVGPGPAPSTVAGANVGGPSMAVNPNFESDATAFETQLGGLAFSAGSGAAAALTAKARAYIEAKVPAGDFKNLGAETRALLEKCGTAKTSFAGAVGTDAAAIQQLLLTAQELDDAAKAAGSDAEKLKAIPQPGNLREQMTFIYNFASNILTKDLLNTKKDQLDQWIEKSKLDKQKIDERMKYMEQQAQLRKQGGQAKPGEDGKSSWDPLGLVPKTGGAPVAGEAAPAGKDAGAVAGQWSARAPRKDAEKAAGQPASSDLSARTAGDVAAVGAGLSKREETFMGIGGPSDALKWSEGAKVWILNERDKWVQAMRALSLPLAAGPSGTTSALMNAAAMLGGAAPVDTRMACIGYLLPIRAHSLVEVCSAAAAFGVPFTAGKKIYHDLPPLTEEQLRNCGRPGPDGKKLFPDEAPAPATADAGSAAAGAQPGAPRSATPPQKS